MRSERLNRASLYVNLASRYLAEARDYLIRGDCEKASESLWESLMSALNALSIARMGEPLTEHHKAKSFAKQLALELSDPKIYKAFRDAEKLHASFYHKFLTIEDLEELLPRMESAVRKILKLVERSIGSWR